VSGANVGALLTMNAEELKRAAEGYKATEEELKALALSGAANTRAGRAAAHARRVAALGKRLEAGEEERAAAAAGLGAAEAAAEEVRGALFRVERRSARLQEECARLDAVIAALPPAQAAALAQLAQLSTAAAGLAEQAAGFKAGAREHRASLLALQRALVAEREGGAVAVRVRELEEGRGERLARFSAARAALGERARLVAKWARALEDFPGRGELAEYERRFGELSDSSVAKLDETRAYFTRHNTLQTKMKYLTKESSIMQDLLEKYAGSVKGGDKRTAAAYLAGVEGYITGLGATLAAARSSCSEREAGVVARQAQLQELVTTGRRYARAVKELQEEVERNEALVRSSAAPQ
jgi:hypothetical protein